MTRYDKERDAYHCSYGIPSPALAVMDPERELIVRVNRNNFRVVGFSIPNFTEWHKKHADEEGALQRQPPGRLADGADRHERAPRRLVGGGPPRARAGVRLGLPPAAAHRA